MAAEELAAFQEGLCTTELISFFSLLINQALQFTVNKGEPEAGELAPGQALCGSE